MADAPGLGPGPVRGAGSIPVPRNSLRIWPVPHGSTSLSGRGFFFVYLYDERSGVFLLTRKKTYRRVFFTKSLRHRGVSRGTELARPHTKAFPPETPPLHHTHPKTHPQRVSRSPISRASHAHRTQWVRNVSRSPVPVSSLPSEHASWHSGPGRSARRRRKSRMRRSPKTGP